jgi:hypothetical protein
MTGHLIILMILAACSIGLQSGTDIDCTGGFERSESGDCQSTAGSDADLGPNEACETSDDCPLDRCPDGAIGCTCLAEEGVCVPTCDTAEDCPALDDFSFECDIDGTCSPTD